jgi:hypothetical protein
MKFGTDHIDATILTNSASGVIDKKIRISIDANLPYSLPVLREALIIEMRSVGSRESVCNILRREIERQEKEVTTA